MGGAGINGFFPPPSTGGIFKGFVRPKVRPPPELARSVVLRRRRRSSGNTNNNKSQGQKTIAKCYKGWVGNSEEDEDEQEQRLSLKEESMEQSKEMVTSGGPPRWFSPLGCCGCPSNSSSPPLLLFLPGIDGLGLGLVMHHQRLGEIFDIWCLHIPIMDRTPFTDLVKLVEGTVRSEHNRSPNRPIYLVGESLGGRLALAVAAHNPDIDFVLILSNRATCFNKSQLQPLLHLLQIMPKQFLPGLPYTLSSISGIPLTIVMAIMEKGFPLVQIAGGLSQGIIAWASYISVLADVLPGETLLWKLQMLESASLYVNAHLGAVKAQTLILSSGRDQLLPSEDEGERLLDLILIEDGIDLVTIIKGTSFYRRAKCVDYASDYMPPSPSEFTSIYELYRWIEVTTSPVMISTLENGKMVRGLEGIPSEGPVLFVGYHMLLALDTLPMCVKLWAERKIPLRPLVHPMMFERLILGIVPVSATNLYKLLSSKSHVLLFPGGVRKALHRKGEENKLFWPEQSELVRTTSMFGAKIIPFGAVGEDDVGQVLFDYDDLMKIPYFKSEIEELNQLTVNVRRNFDGEVAKQDFHNPLILPKFPGCFYYFFGKPIETEGRLLELGNRDKAQELYTEIKSKVERCIAFLKEKRETDPHRNILPRLVYQATNGFDCEVPTFEY
ncbi:Acyltransferase-like protein [Camellia lanceoleosa]|uniref:Acyltransferase-like protein n=1 Tax=Camellia lanceoleosa TaxID=1840588 RepID=A0ACC0J0C7_9ERIC|nr:Acyltransferase-like protein [Camellia lanceoleosa]